MSLPSVNALTGSGYIHAGAIEYAGRFILKLMADS
jgi:hypothetical protein